LSEGEIQNSIIIASPMVFTLHMLAAPVRSFLSLEPAARLEVRVLAGPEAMRAVLAGEADFGIVAARPRDNRFDFRPLHEYSWSLIAPRGKFGFKSNQPGITEMADKPFVMPRANVSLIRSSLDEEFQRSGLSYEVAIEVDNHDCVKRFVEAGLGISILPNYALTPNDRRRLMVLITREQFPPEQVGIITVRGKQLPALVERLASTLEAEIPKNDKATNPIDAGSE